MLKKLRLASKILFARAVRKLSEQSNLIFMTVSQSHPFIYTSFQQSSSVASWKKGKIEMNPSD